VPHSHDAFEETIYGLKGTTSWTVDGESIGIGAGEALCVPRGAVHGFQNSGGTDATFLAIASPGVFGPAYFREVGEVLAASAGGPPDVAARPWAASRQRSTRRCSRDSWPSRPMIILCFPPPGWTVRRPWRRWSIARAR
jgi:uncharacterized cupin superfamily protein